MPELLGWAQTPGRVPVSQLVSQRADRLSRRADAARGTAARRSRQLNFEINVESDREVACHLYPTSTPEWSRSEDMAVAP